VVKRTDGARARDFCLIWLTFLVPRALSINLKTFFIILHVICKMSTGKPNYSPTPDSSRTSQPDDRPIRLGSIICATTAPRSPSNSCRSQVRRSAWCARAVAFLFAAKSAAESAMAVVRSMTTQVVVHRASRVDQPPGQFQLNRGRDEPLAGRS
jgi:hypothetical protein